MKCSKITFLLLASALCLLPATSTQWIHLRSSQFELYTTNTEEEGRELIDVLERAQSFMKTEALLGAQMSQEHPQAPVRIIALRSRTEYQPFRLSPSAFSYFRHRPLGDYIVLQDIRPEHRQAAIHEYMHFLFRQAGLTLPLWLNEGLADFYSSMDSEESQMRVGGVLPSRLRTLQAQASIDLTTLFAVDHQSPFYNNREKVSIFYAESWALVHMLALDPDSAARLPRLIRLISAGVSTKAAFAEVYGKSVLQIESALRVYLPLLSCSSGVSPKTVRLDIQVASGSYWRENIASDMVSNNNPAISPSNVLGQ